MALGNQDPWYWETLGGSAGPNGVEPDIPQDVTGGPAMVGPSVGGSTTTTTNPPPNPEFNYPAYDGPMSPNYQFLDVPGFKAPQFTPPNAETVQNEPGYAFGLSEGEKALQQSAAAKGVLNTGGTLKDIMSWGVNYAGQHYNDAFNRALQTFGTQYQGAKDEYAPLLTQWQTRQAMTQRAADLAFQRAWDQYTYGGNLYLDWTKILQEQAK
jgi:hypothetical protein